MKTKTLDHIIEVPKTPTASLVVRRGVLFASFSGIETVIPRDGMIPKQREEFEACVQYLFSCDLNRAARGGSYDLLG